MEHSIHYTELINILKAARIQFRTWFTEFGNKECLETIEKIKDLEYKLYKSKATYFKIVDDNPF